MTIVEGIAKYAVISIIHVSFKSGNRDKKSDITTPASRQNEPLGTINMISGAIGGVGSSTYETVTFLLTNF